MVVYVVYIETVIAPVVYDENIGFLMQSKPNWSSLSTTLIAFCLNLLIINGIKLCIHPEYMHLSANVID